MPLLEKSVSTYKELAALTKGTYLYANSMQTQQRKIPIRGANGTFKTWEEMLPPFEKELARFKFAVDSIDRLGKQVMKVTVTKEQLHDFAVDIGEPPVKMYSMYDAVSIFSDTALKIEKMADEISMLHGLKLSWKDQINNGTTIEFGSIKPVKVLVGFFKPQRAAFSKDSIFLKEPELETNASANDYGQSEIKIANGLVIKGMPPVNIHSYSFPAGVNTLKLAKGICLIVGFVDGKQAIPVYDAGLTETGTKKEIDWLFE